ncbi:SURF1 family protein [Roseobacter denitrificans]|uniref:SURF1-like protein n=1 Tax=Roseobacter denitrificans (strain ATCC 33942 / OCh 114) TaxID=375451 RepID=Q167V7_ROSDO|nr:SURF1 family protein [Roseobacter denitrificans]ABG31736.1 SURF1 family protein, putative [Roseobacter denitrificans OCh 114]AVL51319.1 SURF1 family protein [Roseobacter denitrificans]SFF87650.1 surfeit locus 1 family protein [Roseobacter denitrificans OCh 114]
MGRLVFLVVIGLGGAAILISLGVWQVQRLAWKEGVIAQINSRIAAEPVALPMQLDPTRDAYLPVRVTGTLRADYIRVLVSKKDVGAGYRIIRPLLHPDGDILIDLGFVTTENAAGLKFEEGPPLNIVGNLQWPQEVDGFTPEPDLARNIWFARDVDAMAAALGTRPILVVRRDAPQLGGPLSPMPVDTRAIPNDHLQYAVTWFSLAAIWSLMTFFFLRRKSGAIKS